MLLWGCFWSIQAPLCAGTTAYSTPGCPGSSVSVPLAGRSLQSYSTQICEPVASTLPAALQDIVPPLTGPVSIELDGSRDDASGAPLARRVSVSVAGGRYTGDIAIPQSSSEPWAASVNGYNFAFDQGALNVTLEGRTISVPLDTVSRRRQLLSDRRQGPGARRMQAALEHMEGHASAASGRRLAQDPDSLTPPAPGTDSIFALRFILTKCSPARPVTGAEVTALVSGFNRIDYPIPLEPGGDGSAGPPDRLLPPIIVLHAAPAWPPQGCA